MRQAFAHELADLENRLQHAFDDASDTLGAIGDTLAKPSDRDPRSIREAAERLRAASRGIDAELVILIGRQAPVAGDLRLVLGLVQVAHHGALISNQFGLIGEQLAVLNASVIDRACTGGLLGQMARLAGGQLRDAVAAFVSRDQSLAQRIEPHDDAIDRLNRRVFEAALELEATPEQRELAMRHVLIARSLERVGDNAVDIADHAALLVGSAPHQVADVSPPRRQEDGG